jgi:hypothetical protein
VVKKEDKKRGSGFDHDDLLECWPENQEAERKSNDEFFKKNDPDYQKMLEKHRKANATDKTTS